MVKLVVNGMNYLYGCFLVVEYSNSARMYFKRVKMGSKKEILLTQIFTVHEEEEEEETKTKKKGGKWKNKLFFFWQACKSQQFFFFHYTKEKGKKKKIKKGTKKGDDEAGWQKATIKHRYIINYGYLLVLIKEFNSNN